MSLIRTSECSRQLESRVCSEHLVHLLSYDHASMRVQLESIRAMNHNTRCKIGWKHSVHGKGFCIYATKGLVNYCYFTDYTQAGKLASHKCVVLIHQCLCVHHVASVKLCIREAESEYRTDLPRNEHALSNKMRIIYEGGGGGGALLYDGGGGGGASFAAMC